MAYQMIVGNRGSGKTTTLYQNIFRLLKEGKQKVYLILPEQATFYHEKYIEEVRKGQSLWNLEITSLSRLAQKYIFSDVLTPLGQHLSLYQILCDQQESFSSFQMKEVSAGFVEAFLKTVSETMMNDLSAADLLEKAADFGERDAAGDLGDKLKDIALVLSAIEKQEQTGLFSDNQLLQLFSDVILEKKLFGDAAFFFDDFFDFTTVEYRVLASLFAVGADMEFAFLYKEGHPFFDKVSSSVRHIHALARKNQIEIEEVTLPQYQQKDALGHLEKYYRNENIVLFEEPTDVISLFHSHSRKGEIEGIAQRICNLREQGVPEKAIGICFRDITPYTDGIKEIFPKYHIPFYIDDVTDLRNNALFSYAIGLLRLVKEKYSFASMFAMLKSGLFPIDSNTLDAYENYCLAHGIKGKMFFQDAPWTYVNEEENLNEVISIRDEIKAFLLPFVKEVEVAKDAKSFAAVLWEFIKASRVTATLEQWVCDQKAAGNLLKAEELANAVQVVSALLDQMTLAFPDREFTVTEFFQVFTMGAKLQKLHTIPMGVNEVEISVLGQSRPSAKSVIFLGGINEGEFPNYGSMDGFFNKNDREFLGQENAFWTRNKMFFYENENILIYQGLTLAREKLFLSYCNGVSQDVDGTRHMPSIVIQIIKEMFPHLKDVLQDTTDHGVDEGIFWAADHVIYALGKHWDAENKASSWRQIVALLKENPATAKPTSLALAATAYEGAAKALKPELIEKYLGKKLFLNVSSLEVYKRCPFSYFAKYGLKLKERKELVFQAPDLGNFYHEALRALVEKMHERTIPWADLKEQGPVLLEEILNEMMAKFGEETLYSPEQSAFICSIIKENLLFSIEIMARQIERGDCFVPLRWEVSFGPEQELKSQSFTLDDGSKEVVLTGQIDRVDIAQKDGTSYFRVVDYKSSDKNLAMDEIYYGIKLQLLIYMMIIEESNFRAADTPLVPGGLFYFPMKDVMLTESMKLEDAALAKELDKKTALKGYVVGGEDVVGLYPDDSKYQRISSYDHDVIMQYLHQTIKEVGQELFHGINTISPYRREQMSSCTYCSYHAVCGYEDKIHGKERFLYPMKKDAAFAKIIEKTSIGGEH